MFAENPPNPILALQIYLFPAYVLWAFHGPQADEIALPPAETVFAAPAGNACQMTHGQRPDGDDLVLKVTYGKVIKRSQKLC